MVGLCDAGDGGGSVDGQEPQVRPTGDGDKEAGTAIQGEVIVQFKFTSPVEIQNVTVYSTSSSHSWNGSVLMAYSDGLWRPLIKTFAVVIDDTLNPHDMNDPPVA